MSARLSLFTLLICAFTSAGSASAQNDECNGALALTLGLPMPFSTVGATTSFVWPCADGGNDVWFRVTPPAAGGLTVTTCGSAYDTAIEAFSGTCAALVSIACNDDACSLLSTVSFPVAAGLTYHVRVGGFTGLTGSGSILATLTPPVSNDECSAAVTVQNGVLAFFDTSGSTTSQPWPCAAGGNDIWFRYVAITNGVSLRIETCGSLYDTALEVFEGTCAGLTSLACNDDQCLLQSQIQLSNIVAGRTYIIRVGGFNNQTGPGTLFVLEGPAPVQGCVLNPGFETGDFTGWTVTDIQPSVYPLQVVGAGQSTGMGFFTSTPTEGNLLAVHDFDGGGPGVIRLAQDIVVNSGLTPLSFDYRAAWDMASLPGATLDRTFDVVVRDPATGVVLQSTTILTAQAATSNFDTGPLTGNVSLSAFLGQTVNVSFEWTIPEFFTGPGFFQLDNITCPSGGGGIGTNYCTANANSTGATSHLRASGSTVAAANAVTLVAERLPRNAFGYFLTSTTQGIVMNPGGSAGVLCLGGQIGRYVGPGQIQSSGLAGVIDLVLDLTRTPSPSGFVSVMAGESRNFQLWHRDVAAGGGATSNFTDGLRVIFH